MRWYWKETKKQILILELERLLSLDFFILQREILCETPSFYFPKNKTFIRELSFYYLSAFFTIATLCGLLSRPRFFWCCVSKRATSCRREKHEWKRGAIAGGGLFGSAKFQLASTERAVKRKAALGSAGQLLFILLAGDYRNEYRYVRLVNMETFWIHTDTHSGEHFAPLRDRLLLQLHHTHTSTEREACN